MGISQRVHTGPKKKKDLGTLGRLHPQLVSQSECSDCVSPNSTDGVELQLPRLPLSKLTGVAFNLQPADVTFGEAVTAFTVEVLARSGSARPVNAVSVGRCQGHDNSCSRTANPSL